MIPRVLYTLVALSLTVFVHGAPSPRPQAIEVGDAVTPIAEVEVEVDEHGVEWIEVPEELLEETIETRQEAEATSFGGGGHHGGPKRCRRLEVRKEWRDLSLINRLAYINSVKCLQSRRALNRTLDAKFTRYDEFVISHMDVADHVHGVAQFLPWHRHFGHLYQEALRDVCGYRGPFPYWDWTRDAAGTAPIANSPLFNTFGGFGGGGAPGTYTLPNFPPDNAMIPLATQAFEGPNAGCISSGPFQGTVVHVGPNKRFTDHCIVRNFLEAVRGDFTPANIAMIMGQATYDEFWNALDGFPFKPTPRLHDSGHGFVGGDMASYYTSNNDPMFYPHHAGLDRLWWRWQAADLSTRLNQINGQTSPYPPHGAIDLDWVLPFSTFAPSRTVRETMDPRNEPYCYTY